MESDEPDPDSDLVLAIAQAAQRRAAKEAATREEGKYVPFNCRLILTSDITSMGTRCTG